MATPLVISGSASRARAIVFSFAALALTARCGSQPTAPAASGIRARGDVNAVFGVTPGAFETEIYAWMRAKYL